MKTYALMLIKFSGNSFGKNPIYENFFLSFSRNHVVVMIQSVSVVNQSKVELKF